MKKGREWHFNILFLLFSTPAYLTFTNYHHLHRLLVAAFPKENFDNFGSTPWFHSPFPVLQVEAGKVGLEWNPQAADRTWVGGRSVGKCRGEKCRYPGYRPPPRTHTLASHWKGQSWLLISIMAINRSDIYHPTGFSCILKPQCSDFHPLEKQLVPSTKDQPHMVPF